MTGSISAPRRSLVRTNRQQIEARILEAATNLAGQHSLAELARLVSKAAPKQRTPLSTEARVPWSLIMAIRLKLGVGYNDK